ncbi:MAG: acetate--CoA ligase family protein [Leptolyngbyaceae bacterium]|nr:acetate--CoA ligase family protein [Leptolyngbyaceae bacterium]
MITTCNSFSVHKSTVFQFGDDQLTTLFEPKNIAIFGANNNSGTVGNSLLKNLLESPFYGAIFPIHPSGERVFDIPTFSTIEHVPGGVDLAVIATPLSVIPHILEDCVEAGVKSAIAISPGLRETGAISPAVEKHLRQVLNGGTIRLLGPNSLGVMNPRKGLNATLSSTMALPGNIGFVSQSGALCRAVLDWSFHENVGFSAFISMGTMLDIEWGDLISYLGRDPYTQSIVIHMESLRDAHSFLAAARHVTPIKPIILLKGGCTEAAVKAAIAHTGGIGGNDDVFEAALQRCGVLRVNRISELFNMSEVLAKRKFQPQGNRLTIITNSGGLGVLATDALVSTGGQLAELTPKTLAQLEEILPSDWSHSNPIDILGDADGDRYQQAIEVAIRDPHTDGLLVILAPQGAADPTQTAEKLKDTVNRLQPTALNHKPILASWVGGAEVLAGETILNRYQIPTYPYLDSAARLFNLMWQQSYCLQGLYETPTLSHQSDAEDFSCSVVTQLIQSVQQEGRTTLTPAEAATLLSAYGLPILPTRLATCKEDAVAIAREMGGSVVLKPGVTRTEAVDQGMPWGIVLRSFASDADIHQAYFTLTAPSSRSTAVVLQPLVEREGAYELIISSAIDPQVGPVMRFGGGGWLLDSYGDSPPDRLRHWAVALPPLTETLAQRLIEQTQIYPVLQGKRGHRGVNLESLKTIVMRFSQLVVEQPQIQAIEINPLLMRPENSRSL